jgi:hypothetical protein
MSIEDKIANAKPTTWISDGIPKWKVRLIVWFTKLKAKLKIR